MRLMVSSVNCVAFVVVPDLAPRLFGQRHQGEKIGMEKRLPPPLEIHQADSLQIREKTLKSWQGEMPALPLAAIYGMGAIGAGGVAV